MAAMMESQLLEDVKLQLAELPNGTTSSEVESYLSTKSALIQDIKEVEMLQCGTKALAVVSIPQKNVQKLMQGVHILRRQSIEITLVNYKLQQLSPSATRSVFPLSIKQYDTKKLLITNISQEVEKDFLIILIEKQLDLELHTDFTIDFRSHFAIISFQKSVIEKKLDEMILKLTQKKVKGQYLTVERCEVNHSIIVAGITNKSFTTEDALTMYFEHSRSGGGEDVLERVEMLGKDRAKVTFNDPSVIERVLVKKHDRLGPNVTITEYMNIFETSIQDSNKKDEWQPELVKAKNIGIYRLDPLVVDYIHYRPIIFEDIHEQYQVTIVTDNQMGTITISPTDSSPPDWLKKSEEMLWDVLSCSVHKTDIHIPPEVFRKAKQLVTKLHKKDLIKFHFRKDERENDKLSVAGDYITLLEVKKEIKELSRQLIKKHCEIEVKPEDYAFLKGFAIVFIKQMHSNVKLLFHDNRSALSIDGSLKDVDELEEKFPQYLSHASICVHLDPLIVEFFRRDRGRQVLEKLIKPGSQVVPFFTITQNADKQNVLHLLCPHDCAAKVETLASDIQREVAVKHNDLPESFRTHVANTSKYQSIQDNLTKKYIFSSKVDQNHLIIVSLAKDVEIISRELMELITEACSVTKSINLKRGVWRLFHGPMEKNWTDLMSELKEKGIEIVSLSKPIVKKPFIQIKGEVRDVEYATEKVLALQANVKERQIPISRPGICQYFFNDSQGQIVLRGLETDAKVCIEVGVSEEEQSVSDDVSKGIRHPQFERLCFGTTAEMKTVSVYIGDITEFNKAEVIVNSANDRLSHGAGVAKAIADKGGPVIQQDSDIYIRRKGIVRVGDAILFNNVGNLPSSYRAIVHAVGPHWSRGRETARDIALLKRVIRKSFEKAKEFSSIALPAVSSGIFGFPVDVCADTLFEAVVEFSQQESSSHLSEINFVVFPDYADEFLKAAEKYLKTFQSLVENRITEDSCEVKKELFGVHYSQTKSQSNPVCQKSLAFTNSTQQHHKPTSCSFSLPHGLKLELLKGDISCDDSDVIVNTTQQDLKLLNSGVAGALLKKGGPALQTACDDAVRRGQRATSGKVVATIAPGQLKCKSVFHISLYNNKKLNKIFQTCLEEADKSRYQSIAFPAIGTGLHGYSASEAVKNIVETLKNFTKGKGPKYVKVIRIIAFEEVDLFDQFVASFKLIGESGGFIGSIAWEQGLDTTIEHPSMLLSKISLETEIILYIFSDNDDVLTVAENHLRAIIDSTFISKEVDDPKISALSISTIYELESFAKVNAIAIEIDRDPVLHSIKLHGRLENVMKVKDKVRKSITSLSEEQSQKAVAEVLYKTVRWMRMTSQETEEDYGEELNYRIEQAYQEKQKVFDVKGDSYIKFDNLEEKNKITDEITKVKRVDFTEQEEKPEHWDHMAADSESKESYVHLVTLPVGNKEYNTIETAFNKTMRKGSNYTQIVSIQRLQNPALYKQYVVRKREMNKHNPKDHPNEQWLWHGTSSGMHNNISTRGFNRSFTGMKSTSYGKGVYFARDASYSHNETTPDANGQRHMYYTQVLTGEFTVGNSSMIVPPAKNPQIDANILFDATVDNTSNPSIFVVYNDGQNYPAYLVHYH